GGPPRLRSLRPEVPRRRRRTPAASSHPSVHGQQVVGMAGGASVGRCHDPLPLPGRDRSEIPREDGPVTEFFRFPQTPHLAWLGEGQPRDDKVLTPDEVDALLAGEVVVEEKVDGANI